MSVRFDGSCNKFIDNDQILNKRDAIKRLSAKDIKALGFRGLFVKTRLRSAIENGKIIEGEDGCKMSMGDKVAELLNRPSSSTSETGMQASKSAVRGKQNHTIPIQDNSKNSVEGLETAFKTCQEELVSIAKTLESFKQDSVQKSEEISAKISDCESEIDQQKQRINDLKTNADIWGWEDESGNVDESLLEKNSEIEKTNKKLREEIEDLRKKLTP